MQEFCVNIILSGGANHFLALFAVLLVLTYVAVIMLASHWSPSPYRFRRARLGLRAFNWLVFGIAFGLFNGLVDGYGLETWRATVRVALFFLMAVEMAYNIGLISGIIKDLKWTHSSQQSSQ